MITRKNRSAFFWLIAVTVLLLSAGAILPFSAQPQADVPLINEVMAANRSVLADEDGDYSDWIEIYNPGTQAINLSGWSLSDDPEQPDKWPFPDRTLAGGEYLVVFASGKHRTSPDPDAPLHTNFRLRKSGEYLGLHRRLDPASPDDMVLNVPVQFADLSYGRHGEHHAFVPGRTV